MSVSGLETPSSVPGEYKTVSRAWDYMLLAATGLLIAIGVVAIYSASAHYALKTGGAVAHYPIRQLIGIGLGLVGGWGVLQVPYRWYRRAAVPVFVAVMILMVLVFVPGIGKTVNGASRWINLRVMNVQPSEYARIALAMVMAHHLSRNESRLGDHVAVGASALIMYLVPLFVALRFQDDLGSMAILAGMFGVAFFIVGIPWSWVIGLIALGAGGFWYMVQAAEYRQDRIAAYLDPLSHCKDEAYQICQGWVAMAEGGWTGVGLGRGVAQQGFLPEAHTDMILAVVTEEMGALAFLLVITLELVILWRGTAIASNARNLYDAVLGGCITAMFAGQMLINAGVVVGVLPAKGLVMPFMSYGATAVTVHVIAVAILLRINLNTHAIRTYGDTECSAVS